MNYLTCSSLLMQKTFLEIRLKYTFDFHLSRIARSVLVLCSLARQEFFFPIATKMLAVGEFFLNSVMNDAPLHLLKVICAL